MTDFKHILFNDGHGSMLIIDDVIAGLKRVPDNSVHCAVTSPPYFQLRSYGPHIVKINPAVAPLDIKDILTHRNIQPHSGDDLYDKRELPEELHAFFVMAEAGQEESPDAYVAKMTSIFEEVRRVLRPDGTFWLNIGDSYVVSSTEMKPQAGIVKGPKSDATVYGKRTRFGIKPGNLVGIPWRLALSLQNAGWFLRSDLIWAKGVSFAQTYHGSCLPESVKDRPSRAHEYYFLLSKERHYYYDQDALREEYVSIPDEDETVDLFAAEDADDETPSADASGRNLRTVWCVKVEPSRHAHTAPMPKGLIRPAIQLGTSAMGVCKDCGAPYVRMVAEGDTLATEVYTGESTKDYAAQQAQNASDVKRRVLQGQKERKTIGWKKSCACATDIIVPATVLDPFFGSGTTGIVAAELGRRFVGTEINPFFANICRERVEAELQRIAEKPVDLFTL